MHEQNESQPKAFIKILFALFTALLVVVLGYLCIQIYTIFHRTYKTETAIAYTMSDNITLKGVAVFQAVDVPGSGNLGYVVQDGERVSAGTILAEQYTDDSQGAMRERLDRLDRAILLLTKSENSSGSDLSVLTTQTRTALYNLLDQIDTASYGAIQDAAEDFKSLAMKHQKEFELNIQPDIMVKAEEQALFELMTILVDNATKYCDPNGKVSVQLSQSKLKRAILEVSNTYQDGKNVDYSKFFDRFYREDESHNRQVEGYGIGLSMAQSLVRIFKGKLTVYYKKESITFRVIL